jgi:hypothetical protein
LVTESVLQLTEPEVREVEFSEPMVPEFSAMLLATVLPIDTLEPCSTDVSMAGVTTLLVELVSVF